MSKRGSDLATRLGVGLVLIGLAFAALWAGGLVFWAVVSVAGLLMLGEWAGLAKAGMRETRIAQAALLLPLVAMAPDVAGPGPVALALVVAGAAAVWLATRQPMLAGGLIYVGVPVLSLVALREHQSGLMLTLWAMALVWACDSGAYFAGRAIGGARLAPQISPNKTWAGFIGGILSALLFGIAMHLWAGLGTGLAIATPFLAVLAQFGDLYESHLKRRAGVKDSGNLLPGHGGLMDRLDGLVAVAPAAALLVMLLA